jgi:uncharacterized protein (DUF362 family)
LASRAFLGRTQADEDYLSVIRQGLKFVAFGQDLGRRPRVFIKPNLTFPSFRPGVMTSPAALEAAIVAIKDFADEIWVGDSDSGGYNPFPMEEVYSATGINEFAARHGINVVNLTRLERVSVPIQLRHRTITLDLPRLLTDEIDYLVTMPVPKIHMNTGVSLTFKNQWGCIPQPSDRLRLHPHFKEVVVAVNRAVKARFAIIDGRFGLNISGPMRGEAVPLGWTCVAEGIGAGAAICCHLMRVPLASVAHLRYAQRLGLIPLLEEIESNVSLNQFVGPRFCLRRKWTDWPGYFAFQSPLLARIAYFSKLSGPLHKLLYLFREPFYDYKRR